ncbi:MAG: acetylornithine/succinyldiaminopimelate/putrescine aminotransferase, partial [Thermoproteota archaeon]
QEEQFFLKLIAKKFPYEFTSLSQLNKFIYELNIKAINREPQILCLEDAFHGKTLGALLLTDSTMYTESFGLNQFSTFVIHSKKTNDYVEEHINHSLKSFTQITITKTDLDFERVSISNLAATFIEPIQGECGIHPLDKDFLTHLNTLSRKNKIPFVSDEIQAGLFRCGKMAALHNYDLDADIYCFAKGLGGSLTKIGVTSINPSVYSHEFSILHTSTFCEDPLSSNIAFKVLEVLERDLIQNKMYQKIKLKEELQQLQTEFPSFIKEIRGEGLLLSLEIDSALANQCMEFKIFEHSGYLGHFLSSALLHNERVRMTPSLSSPNTLRVQPSIYFSSEETKWFIGGLRNLFNAAKELDMTYFYQHVFPGEELLTADLLPSDVNHTKKATKPLAVFFCHMINIDHAKTLVTSQKFIDDKVYQKKISKIVEVLDFAPLYRKDLKGVKQDIELMFMVHPITSFDIVKAMKTKNSDAIVEKLQRGIDYVKSLGATTIGLGQFTSIVSYNGLKLDARGLNITTGNAYTTAISVKACREACKDKGIDIGQTHIGCIGMAGNIVSVTASLLADDCKQMTFIYHTALSESPKYIKTMIGFFKNVARSTSINTFTTNVQKLMNEIKYDFSVKNTLEIVSMLEAKNILKLSTEIKEINNCEIILSGASSPKPFIDASGFKSGTIVIDIGVPTNIVKDSLTPTTVYLQGGLASLPKINNEQQFLDPPSFNLKPGTSYACLSETLILTYANKANIQNTGELTKEVVLETQKLGEEMGFDLAAFKLKDSL